VPDLLWLTDIHLDFLDTDGRRRFFRRIGESCADGVVVTGDIGEADTVEGHLAELAEAAAHLSEVLPGALARYSRLLVLTHVPPFRGPAGTPDASRMAIICRTSLRKLSARFWRRTCGPTPPGSRPCSGGHTHGGGKAEVLPNLTVFTGAADYGRPRIQKVLHLS